MATAMLHPRPQSHLPDCLAKMKERGGGEALPRSNPFLFALAFCYSSFFFFSFVFTPSTLGKVFFEKKRRGEEKRVQCSKKAEKENMEKKRKERISNFLFFFLEFYFFDSVFIIFSRRKKVSNTRNDKDKNVR